MKLLSLIVPAFNEEENIVPFYNRVSTVFADYNGIVEIIYIDDGSRDRTYEKIAELSERNTAKLSVRGISFSRNFGKEAAMLAGLKAAAGDYLSIIDADLQQDPSYVRMMADMLDGNEDADVIAAYQEQRKEGRLQAFLKGRFYKMINRLSEVHFEENASDFRTFRRSVRDAILSLTETNRFSKGIFAWVGFHTVYIPYQVREREHGQSSWSLKKLFRYAMDGISGFSMAGLKAAFPISGILLLAAIVWLVIGAVFAWGTVMTVLPFLVFLVGSLQMAAIGLIGNYVGRTYAESRHRPSYIVRRECGQDTSEYDIIKHTINRHNTERDERRPA